tara:strand:+ start:1000 stop:1233 length:234 start_codon:yes stop_codon:yes gene_type:complete
MKVGDLIDVADGKNGDFPGLVLKIWKFKEYCDAIDDSELEYDIDAAWDHWQLSGPMVDVLNPVTKDIVKIWAGGPKV